MIKMEEVIQALRNLETLSFDCVRDSCIFLDAFEKFKDELRKEIDMVLSNPVEMFGGAQIISEDKTWEIINELMKWVKNARNAAHQ